MESEVRETVIRKELSYGAFIELHKTCVGEDIHLLLSGGDAPHIGCVVMSEPRLSLTGDGSISATSSVINAIGHKDEEICRLLSEAVCRREGCRVVCAGGFHADGMTREQIEEVKTAVGEMVSAIEEEAER